MNAPRNRALTVKQPWAWAIVRGDKDVENRSRPTKHRGRLYIHAGLGWDDRGLDAIGMEHMPPDSELLTGMVIGTVDVMGCHHADQCGGYDDAGRHRYCSEWALPDHYHWVVGNARRLACPFPEKGKLGIWTLGGADLVAVR